MSAYYCSPSKGSDWRVGWGRALEAARRFDVFVVTSEQSRADIEEYCRRNGSPENLRFFYVGSKAADRWVAAIPKWFLYVNPLQYAIWQSRAISLARTLHRQYNFDLAHQVTLIGYRNPGRLYELGIPFIWGPIGGMQNYPLRFLSCAGIVGALKEGLRTIVNSVQMLYSRRVRRAMRSAAVVLAANSKGQQAIRRYYRRESVLLLETGLDSVNAKPARPATDCDLRILWSGDLNTHKALHLLLRALGSVRDHIDFHLRILGKGPLLHQLRDEARRLGIDDRCEFMGFLPLQQAMDQSEWADVFVFTSLRDTSGNVMLEAMSRGVPVICFDHQGAGDIINASCGIKIPVTNPCTAIQDLAKALVSVARDRGLLATLSEGALRRAKQYLWSSNGTVMAGIYEDLLRTRREFVEGSTPHGELTWQPR